jgi:hypothetical protein
MVMMGAAPGRIKTGKTGVPWFMIFILRHKFVLFEKFVVNLLYFTFLSKKCNKCQAAWWAEGGHDRKATARTYSLSRVPRFANW